MEKNQKRRENTDAEETVFFQAASSGRSTDQYDTRQLSASQIRQQAARQNQNYSRYGQGGDNPNIYRQSANSGNSTYYRQNGSQNGSRSSQGRTTGGQSRQTSGQHARQQQPQRQSQQQPQRQQQHSSQRPPQSRQAPPRKKTPFLLRVIKLVLVLVIVLYLFYSAIAMMGILSMNRVETGERGVTDASLDASYVKNVLVIGTDTRDPEEERGRSDSMILVSFNSRTHDLTMTSFMRDAYVEIPGNGSGKLNAAYSYGGAELLMDTIAYNYDVEIDDYVMVTFAACAEMIDAVGGVELTISDNEAQAVNEILISEVNEIMGDDREDDLLSGGGTLTLDGKQALSYSRIRYVGNADFERTERQRTVMTQVIGNVKKNPFRLVSVCMKALPEMTTNLSVGSLYGYAITTPVKLLYYEMVQQRIPADGSFSDATINGESVLQVDFAAAKQQLEETVYG